MKHYLLIYHLKPDYMERRGEYRSEHLAMAWKAHEDGNLILGGALQEPSDKAILLFKGNSPDQAETFARNDPYVIQGLVARWEVRPWATVAGDLAANPVR